MPRRYRKPRRPRKNYFWKGVKRYGFSSALKWEFSHPRRYPRYPIWLIPMLISMVIIAIILYFYPIDYVPLLFYILETIVVGYMIFRLLKRLDRIRIKGSLLRLWGLKILSALITAFGVYLIYLVLMSFFLTSFEMLLNQESWISQIVMFGNEWNAPFVIPYLLILIGIGLMSIGAYLLFKFKMKTGQVIWVGRF